jgi:hypothetical protein
VRDEDRRDPELELDAADLVAQLGTHLGVEGRERLVEEQQTGSAQSARASATRCC